MAKLDWRRYYGGRNMSTHPSMTILQGMNARCDYCIYIYIPHIRYVTTGVLGTTNEGAKCIISQCTILWVFECRIDMFAGQIFMLVAISISTTTATVGTIPDLTTILGWTSIAIECAPLQDTSHNWKTNMVDFQLAMSVHRTKYQLSNE